MHTPKKNPVKKWDLPKGIAWGTKSKCPDPSCQAIQDEIDRLIEKRWLLEALELRRLDQRDELKNIKGGKDELQKVYDNLGAAFGKPKKPGDISDAKKKVDDEDKKKGSKTKEFKDREAIDKQLVDLARKLKDCEDNCPKIATPPPEEKKADDKKQPEQPKEEQKKPDDGTGPRESNTKVNVAATLKTCPYLDPPKLPECFKDEAQREAVRDQLTKQIAALDKCNQDLRVAENSDPPPTQAEKDQIKAFRDKYAKLAPAYNAILGTKALTSAEKDVPGSIKSVPSPCPKPKTGGGTVSPPKEKPKKKGNPPRKTRHNRLGVAESYSFRVAVQVPNECVATKYIVTDTTVTEEPVGAAVTEIEVAETPPPPATPDQNEVVNQEQPIPAPEPTPPAVNEPTAEPPPTTTEETPPPTKEETPQPEQPAKPTEQTEQIPATPEEAPPPEQPAEPDLGLAKVQQSVVTLVLTGGDTGKPIEGATVKLLDDEPALPVAETEHPKAPSDSYQNEPSGGETEGGGNVTIPVSDVGNPEEAEPAKPVTADIKINEIPTERTVVGVEPKTEEERKKQPRDLIDPKLENFVVSDFWVGETGVVVLETTKEESEEVKRTVEQSTYVTYVEDDPCRQKEGEDDPLYNGAGLWGQDFDNQWAIKRIGFAAQAPTAFVGRNPQPVTVAVIDTGVDWNHPDLSTNSFWRNTGEIPGNGIDDDGNGYVDDIIGWNFVQQNNLPWDYDGHGTFVAGVIAAKRNNGVGIAGINPTARIMVLKALDEFGQGNASMISQAIVYAADNGARVINLSLGGPQLTKTEQLAVNYANKKGVLVVVAAGNDASPVAGFSPGGLADVITVAATDRKDRRAGFSNWGPLVDIAAPGVDVLSLRARNTDLLAFMRGVTYKRGQGIVGPDRAYYRASGTSFAAPMVAGTLSLMLGLQPDLTAAEAKRMLLNSAKDIETPGVDNYTGYGLLDAVAALKADRNFFIEARIANVAVVKTSSGPVLRVVGTADANSLAGVEVSLGAGEQPKTWKQLPASIASAVRDGPLIDIPASMFKGTKTWTIRIIAKHNNGQEREARFLLTLG